MSSITIRNSQLPIICGISPYPSSSDSFNQKSIFIKWYRTEKLCCAPFAHCCFCIYVDFCSKVVIANNINAECTWLLASYRFDKLSHHHDWMHGGRRLPFETHNKLHTHTLDSACTWNTCMPLHTKGMTVICHESGAETTGSCIVHWVSRATSYSRSNKLTTVFN